MEITDEGRLMYSMDEIAQSRHCTRQEALEFVRAAGMAVVRIQGDTYVSEDEYVRYMMEEHGRARR